MRTLFNHTLRSIRDNIGQLVIIILTVTVVSMLFFATLTIGGLFTNLQTSLQARLGKDTDVTVSATVFSETQLAEFCESSDDIEYVEKYLQTAGLYKPADGNFSKAIMVEATDLYDYSVRHGREIVVCDSYEYSTDYPSVWVGRSFAEENGIKAGDSIDIYIEVYKTYRTLTVTYVCENYGIFANNVVNSVLTDFTTIGNKGLISTANIKLKEGVDKEFFQKELSAHFGEDATVTDSIDYAEIDRVVSSNNRLLRIILVFVTALMIFLLFTSFLVVAKKRINELTVFKTVGATNGQIAAMLTAEGIFYGLTGGILGTVLGRIGMGIAVSLVIPNFPDAVKFGAEDYILSILFGVVVSGVSSVIPILRAGRESVRTATGDKAKAVKKRNPLPTVISAAVLLVAAVTTILFDGNVIAVVFLVLSAGVFTYFVTPFLLIAVSSVFRGKGAVRLSGLTVKRNPSSNTLAGMVGAIIVFSFVVLSIINVVIGAVTPKNTRYEADFVVDSISTKDMAELDAELGDIYGVTSSYTFLTDTAIWRKGDQTREYTVYGAESGESLTALCRDLSEESIDLFDTTLNPVIITYDVSNRFGLKVGDKVNITIGTEEEERYSLYNDFTVVGIDYTVTADDRLMIIRSDGFRVDGLPMEAADSIIFLNVSDDVSGGDIYRDIRDKVEEKSCYILGLNDWAYATSVGIVGITALLRVLQVMVSAVALVGVVNLTAVTVLERRREYDVLRASGLDGGSYALLSAMEGLIISLAGTVIGILLSVVINTVMPLFGRIIDRYVTFAPFPWELAVIGAVFIALYSAVFCITALLRKQRDGIERNITV